MMRASSLAVSLDGRLGAFHANIAFSVPSTGVTALFGPSGCGKTTVLRCVAGLQNVRGRIEVSGECWQDSDSNVFLPPHERQVGYVFQEASLFPHLSVRNNLLYGARRRLELSPAWASFDEIVALLGIGRLLDRSPVALSGGERQRVAVGRALLTAPRILLMDEPLSALDRMTKDEILPYLEQVCERFSLPILYVTHDLREIERLADTLVLMREGHVVACGHLHDLQTDPSLPLLSSPEATVVLAAKVVESDEDFGLTRIDVRGGRLLVPGIHGAVGKNCRIRISASDVSLARTAALDSTILNSLPSKIIAFEASHDKAQVNVILALGHDGTGDRIVARVTRKSIAVLNFKPGDGVFAQIKSVALMASRAHEGSVKFEPE